MIRLDYQDCLPHSTCLLAPYCACSINVDTGTMKRMEQTGGTIHELIEAED